MCTDSCASTGSARTGTLINSCRINNIPAQTGTRKIGSPHEDSKDSLHNLNGRDPERSGSNNDQCSHHFYSNTNKFQYGFHLNNLLVKNKFAK